ncbi:MAG: DUF222 domain-containing protein, partial [Mycobacterium sp.]
RALDLLEAADWVVEDFPSCSEVLELVERGRRRLLAVSNTIAAQLADRDISELGDAPHKLLADVTRIGPKEARGRLAQAGLVRERFALSGESLGADLPATAKAWHAGLLDEAHVRVITNFFTALPADTPRDVCQDAERFLAAHAVELRSDQLAGLAAKLALTINPDGKFCEQDRVRQSGFSWGPQRQDGMSKGTLWASPELRAELEAFFAKFAEPGMCLPDDPDPFHLQGDTNEPVTEPATGAPAADCPDADTGAGHPDEAPVDADSDDCPPGEPTSGAGAEEASGAVVPQPPVKVKVKDDRAPKQRRHDALAALLKAMLGNPGWGTRHGLPITVVATMTLDELTRAAGMAVTATGTLIPIRDLIRLASQTQPYLAVFDDHKSRALHLAKANRCVTGDQWLMLFARDRGCSKPNCDKPADQCEAHHTKPWATYRRTDINEMTLACYEDHPQVGDDGWDTTLGRDGRVHWTPPPNYPRKTATTNDFHHPERYLSEFQKDGDTDKPDDDDTHTA